MIKVIKKVKVYAPEYLGVKDVVISSNKIEGIYEDLNIPENFINIEVIDGEGKLLFPGFIDNHVHIIGAGGEGGFYKNSRTEVIIIDKGRNYYSSGMHWNRWGL